MDKSKGIHNIRTDRNSNSIVHNYDNEGKLIGYQNRLHKCNWNPRKQICTPNNRDVIRHNVKNIRATGILSNPCVVYHSNINNLDMCVSKYRKDAFKPMCHSNI